MTNKAITADRLARATLVFGVAYFVLLIAGAEFRFGTQQAAAFWPAAGLFVAALMFAPPRHWAPLLIVGVLGDAAGDALLNSRSLLPGALFGVGNAASAVVGALLLRRVVKISLDLSHLRDVLAVVVFAALISPIPSALVGTGTIATVLGLPVGGSTVVTWWLADVIGIVIVTPLLLTWYSAWRREGLRTVRERSLEGALATVLTVAATAWVFTTSFELQYNKMVMMSALAPFFLWASVRFDPRGVTTITFLSSIVIVWGSSNGLGPMAHAGQPREDMVPPVQALLAVLAATTAIVSTVVTERRLALAELSAEGDRKQRILDQLRRQAAIMDSAQSLANFGVWSWTPGTGEVEWSPQLYTIYGRDPERFTPTFDDYLAHVHEDDRERAARSVKTALEAGESVTFSERIVRPDGSIRVLSSSASALSADRGPEQQMVGVCLDVTDLSEALVTLEEQEQRLSVALDAARMGMWVWSLDSEELLWTDAVYDLFGVDRASFDLNYESYLGLIHPDDLEMLRTTLARALEHSDSFEVVHRVVGFDDPERWIRGYGKIARDESGKPVRLTGVCFDVTAERSLEQRLLQSQKMEAVGTLAGGVAHDFNNMLTGIIGFAEIGEEGAGTERSRANFVRILEMAERAAGLTRQLLAFSRRQPLKRRTTELDPLVSGMEDMLGRMIGENVALAVSATGESKPVHVDANHIEQVILNLAINARDSLPGHGGRIEISTGRQKMDESRVRAYENVSPGDFACISVADNGAGMDDATMARIFEPFFTTKVVGQGTGLGLSTAYGIVKQHGGIIEVVSEPGRGTTFSVFLPISTADAAGDGARDTNRPVGGSERILLVEDQEDVRNMVAMQLDKLGYGVETTANCAEAEKVHAGGDRRFDLLLTDMVMPDGSGVGLFHKLREGQPGLRVLFMSGYSREFQELDEENFEFLPKPFRIAELSEAVRSAIGRDRGIGG